jgi:DNA-binding NarL/FixJ family response regulator
MTMTISVLLVDDHALIREGLRRAFEATDDLVVVDEAGSVSQALALARAHEPQTAVVDINLGDGSGIDLCKELRATYPSMGLVILTMYDGDEHLFGALEAGASAFVLKSAPADEVAAAVRQAATSPTAFTANDLAGAMRRRMTTVTVQLTPREAEILQLLGEGMSVAQVATKLFISQSTAKTHMSKLYEKLDASNRTQAVMAAVRLGLLSAEGAQG